MNTLVWGTRWTVFLCYLDHVGFSSTYPERLERLQEVFNFLCTNLNSAECVFGARQTKVLGHLLSADGISPDLHKRKGVN